MNTLMIKKTIYVEKKLINQKIPQKEKILLLKTIVNEKGPLLDHEQVNCPKQLLKMNQEDIDDLLKHSTIIEKNAKSNQIKS